MSSVDIMTDRTLFLWDMTPDDIKFLHTCEQARGSRYVGAEIAVSNFGGRKLNFQSNIKTNTNEWRAFEKDILALRPKPNDDYVDLDYIHAWDWEIYHKVKQDRYNFFKRVEKGVFG